MGPAGSAGSNLTASITSGGANDGFVYLDGSAASYTTSYAGGRGFLLIEGADESGISVFKPDGNELWIVD
jgi:hypothetical protein